MDRRTDRRTDKKTHIVFMDVCREIERLECACIFEEGSERGREGERERERGRERERESRGEGGV